MNEDNNLEEIEKFAKIFTVKRLIKICLILSPLYFIGIFWDNALIKALGSFSVGIAYGITLFKFFEIIRK